MKHLLVTNDFPPKVGGIQSYLWELWRRLPPESTTVLTTPRRGAAKFDAAQPIRVERDRARVLLPTRSLAKRIDRLLNIAEYKRRQAAPGVKVTRRNFGRDRRYPITNRFRDAGKPLPEPDHTLVPRSGRGSGEVFDG